MGDIYISRNEDGELTHSARGTTWSKDGASYIKREKKNGKWVYTYKKFGKSRGNGQPVDMTNATPSSKIVSERQRFAQNEAKTRSGISNRRAQQIQSEAESMKRKSVSAQRNVQKDTRYKINAKTAYLKNKASRNINKGKKKVSELLERLKKQASPIVTKAKKKASANISKTKRKIKNAVSVKETAYITDVSTGKRRPAPTDLFDNTSNKKKYKKQAKAQRHTKRVIAREQAIGKVKHTIKNARSGKVNGYYRNKTAKPVSKNVDKKNAGKKR